MTRDTPNYLTGCRYALRDLLRAIEDLSERFERLGFHADLGYLETLARAESLLAGLPGSPEEPLGHPAGDRAVEAPATSPTRGAPADPQPARKSASDRVARFDMRLVAEAPGEPATAPETPAAPTPLADPPGPATAPPAPQDGALRAPRVYNVPSPRLPPRIPADHRAEVERACAGDLALALECSTTTPWGALVARVKGLVKQRTIDQIEREGDRRALQDRESFRLRLTHALDAPHYTSEAEILERVRQLATWGRSR